MTAAEEREGRRTDRRSAGDQPARTCVGCRRIQPQAVLLRLCRGPDGSVEPDPRREGGGRGAYVCRRWKCVAEAARRGRWTQVFRGPAVLRPETLERLRHLIEPGAGEKLPAEGERDERTRAGVRATETSGKPVEGRW